MQLVRSTLSKTQAHVVRKSSCARGGIRIFIQSIFAVITVASFILIVLMSLGKPLPRPQQPPCTLQICTVICHGAPHYDKYEEDILLAVSDGSTKCRQIILELHEPRFKNGELPINWFSRMPANILTRLSIKKGNLEHLTCGAFMSQFAGSIETLILEDVKIKTWEPFSLVGLTNLKTLTITDSGIEKLGTNALRAVDDTLKTLSVTGGGKWDPINLTGFRGLEELTTVNLSYNDFNNVLSNETFIGLDNCKILYLNNCKITSIGAGAFDNLITIEVLYLNNNYLTNIHPELFKTIVAIENPRPRIHLQNNLWYCSCEYAHLRELVEKDVLLVEAECYSPKEMKGKTFTEFHYSCKNNGKKMAYKRDKIALSDQSSMKNSDFYIEDDLCEAPYNDRYRINSLSRTNKCSSLSIAKLNTSITNYRFNNLDRNWTSWLKSSLLVLADYTVVQISTIEKLNYGLLWYRSNCPYEIYCIDTIPSSFRMYSINLNTEYIFCPIDFVSGDIVDKSCINYDTSNNTSPRDRTSSGAGILAFIITGLLCLIWGAAIVYGIIRVNPNLLRGSKRLVFVKHKKVSALVLPPNVSARSDLLEDKNDKLNENIFTVCDANNKLNIQNFNTMKSVKSNKSISPSYISALQPTDDQLAEWRKNQFNKDTSYYSMKSELSAQSWIPNTYYSLEDNEGTYESLK